MKLNYELSRLADGVEGKPFIGLFFFIITPLTFPLIFLCSFIGILRFR